jgi:hypothetical protein
MEPITELCLSSKPGQMVWWKTLDGRAKDGRLKEWDNGTAIILLRDGSEVAIRAR